jgi:hypothetical protein
MFTWGAIILKVLTLLEWLIEQGQKKKWITEGEARQIAKQQAEVTRKTRYARETLRDIERLSDAELDEQLRSLERPGKEVK